MDVSINTVEELLSDESFLAWYFKSDPQAIDQWNTRIASDPLQKKRADEAVQLLTTITLKEQQVDEQRLLEAEQKLLKATGIADENHLSGRVLPMRSRRIKWWAAAAAAAIIFLTSIIFWQYSRTAGKLSIQTAYGETRQEILPDGSQVMLNANTTLDYTKWTAGKDREVWVNGEAFFHVKKTAQKDRFIVHTGHFDVVVTGTQFNVINRNNKSNVLLKEGSVTVQRDAHQVKMLPGDYVEFNNSGIQKRTVNSAPVLAWTERKFIFENTPMKEVASLVTELYGIKVTLADEAVAASSISGIMPNDNLEVFLQSLEALPEYDVVKSDKEILIRKK
ncbi:FecR family protein [Longitalea arenae]|uniref:FecR family protein n=1 Tax=Longitalea arenae TaxID=2812558 RepID=UPI001967B250|nr:FecR domain-containing protein [Longitalea arenae]